MIIKIITLGRYEPLLDVFIKIYFSTQSIITKALHL